MEETAMYAIIADLDKDNVTLYLGICEISTGLGYMLGPPLGGFLFSAGGFALPFIVLGAAVAPAALLLYNYMPPDQFRGGAKGEDGEDKADLPMRTLLRNPQVVVIVVAAMLANSDYAFLEPTLGDHATQMGLASTPDGIGMLFSIAMTSYTLSCPAIGMLAKRERFGPRPVIVGGLLFQLFGFILIGPCPLLQLEGLGMGQMVMALVLFGVGESMSMTPAIGSMAAEEGSTEFNEDPRAQQILSSFTINWMNMRDGDSGSILWESADILPFSESEQTAHVPAEILQSRAVSREINFSSKEAINNLRLIQKIFFQGQCIEEWRFDFGFVIPGSTNTWQSTIEAAGGDKMIPADILSGNVTIETGFWDGEMLVSTSVIRLFYV